MNKAGKIIIRALASVAIGTVLFYGVSIVCLVILLTSIHRDFLVPTVVVAGIGLGLVLLAWNIRIRLLAYAGCGVFGLALLAAGGLSVHSWWTHGRFAVIRQGVNWHEYRPFAPGNKLVKIGPVEGGRLTGEMPKLDGAYALYPVYAAAVQALFPEDGENYSWIVQTNGSDVTFERLLGGDAEMIFSLAPSKKQLADAAAKGLEYEMTPLLREAFVFYVNAKNPVSNLTTEQLRGIYSGKITDWREVGALKSAAIIPFQRNEGSGSQTALKAMMGNVPVMPPVREDKLGGMGDIIESTADYRNYNEAIGFSFRYFATEMIRNDKIKLLSIDGVAPTRENIVNGTYPLISDGYMITVRPRSENLRKFIAFLLSPQGREIIEKTGYVSVDPVRLTSSP